MNECDIEYPPCEGDEEMAPSLPAGIELRTMEPGDLEEVKSLHEQCFPVRYDNAFYENVVHGVIVRGTEGEREPLYTQVAVVPVDDGFETNTPMMTTRTAQAVGGGSSSALNGDHRGEDFADDNEALEEMAMEIDGDDAGIVGQTTIGGTKGGNGSGSWPVWSAVNGSRGRGGTVPELSQTEWVEGVGVTARRRRKIVGLITCQVIPLERCRDRDRLGLQGVFGRRPGHSEVVYILTLGTDTAYRRRGIGRALLRRCVWLSMQEESIGAVYLHVITTNPPAHRFYESEGFDQLCCITDYYRIDDEMYDCFLYALFVNGAKRRIDWGWAFQGLSRHLRSIVEFFRRTLVQIPEEGRFAATIASVFGAPDKEKKRQIETDRLASEEGTPDEEQGYDEYGLQSASLHDSAAAYALNGDGITGSRGVDGIASPAAAAAAQSHGRGFAWSGSAPSSLARNCGEIRGPADRFVTATDAQGEELAEGRDRVAFSRYGSSMSGITWWDATDSARGGWGKPTTEAHPFGGSGDRIGVNGASSIIDVGGYGSVVDVSAQEDVDPNRPGGGRNKV